MPNPSLIAQTPDQQTLMTLLITYGRRLDMLERRTRQIGQRITIGDYYLWHDGDTGHLLATRTSDGATIVLADFTAMTDSAVIDSTTTDPTSFIGPGIEGEGTPW